jgi:cytochrome c oxidase subunit 2
MKRSRVSLPAKGAALVAALLASASAWADDPPVWARPVDASLDGHRSDWLFGFVTVSISILFIIMVAIILWSSFFHREGKHKAEYTHGMGRGNLLLTAVVSAVIFFGVDGTALYHSYIDLGEAFWNFPTKQDNPVEIEIYAQQWAWNARYAGPDGKFNTPDDVIVLNDLRVPVGRPVFLKIKSKDVLHSFYLPNFRIKQDAVPGSITQLWFQATQTGDFEIGCAQHCGASHYKMRGMLSVLPAEDFARWLSDESVVAQRRYDDKDPDAHWGWDWEI